MKVEATSEPSGCKRAMLLTSVLERSTTTTRPSGLLVELPAESASDWVRPDGLSCSPMSRIPRVEASTVSSNVSDRVCCSRSKMKSDS